MGASLKSNWDDKTVSVAENTPWYTCIRKAFTWRIHIMLSKTCLLIQEGAKKNSYTPEERSWPTYLHLHKIFFCPQKEVWPKNLHAGGITVLAKIMHLITRVLSNGCFCPIILTKITKNTFYITAIYQTTLVLAEPSRQLSLINPDTAFDRQLGNEYFTGPSVAPCHILLFS